MNKEEYVDIWKEIDKLELEKREKLKELKTEIGTIDELTNKQDILINEYIKKIQQLHVKLRIIKEDFTRNYIKEIKTKFLKDMYSYNVIIDFSKTTGEISDVVVTCNTITKGNMDGLIQYVKDTFNWKQIFYYIEAYSNGDESAELSINLSEVKK